MKYIPEGATHTAQEKAYRMFEHGIWWAYADGDWVVVKNAEPQHYTPIKYEVIELNAQKVVEWGGEGLPPVGVECELKAKKSWELVKILAHVVVDPRFNPIAIYMPVNDPSAVVGQAVAGCFRPARTGEQLAAEEIRSIIESGLNGNTTLSTVVKEIRLPKAGGEMIMQWWTVARFPNGSWGTGGRMDDPDYAECEVFRVLAESRDQAKKLAQAQRRKDMRKSK